MPANTFTQMEGYGLFILLVAPSDFATNLNQQIQAAGATVGTVNTYFLNTVAGPRFNLAGKVDITKFQELWTNVFGGLALQLDQTPIEVMTALTPSIPYTDPPCPKPGDEDSIFAQLRK